MALRAAKLALLIVKLMPTARTPEPVFARCFTRERISRVPRMEGIRFVALSSRVHPESLPKKFADTTKQVTARCRRSQRCKLRARVRICRSRSFASGSGLVVRIATFLTDNVNSAPINSPLERPANGRDRLPVYHVRGLTKFYGTGAAEVHALAGVDLDLYSGELVVLLGP